jgi:hypothetical protein
MDLRWVLAKSKAKYFIAWVIGPRTVVVQLPSAPYSIISNHAATNKHLKLKETNAIDNFRIKYVKKDEREKRQFRHLILQFPSDHKLSAELVNKKAGKENRLKLKMFEVTSKYEKLGNVSDLFACWKIAREDVEGKETGDVLDDDNDNSEAYALIKSMFGAAGNVKME